MFCVRRLVVSSLLVMLCAAPVLSQRDFSAVKIEATHVAGKVWMLQGAGGNMAVSIGDDGALLVDDQFEPLSDKILAKIRELGGDRPAFVLNTHWHGDHTGGNVKFGKDGVILAHRNVRERLGRRRELGGRIHEPLPPEGLPVITFDTSLDLHWNGEKIHFFHGGPAHTDGDGVVHFEGSGVFHLGDLFFAGRFPYVDLDSGGSVEGLLDRLETLLAAIGEEDKIIPGHGGLSSKSDLSEYRDVIRETRSIVKMAIARGDSLEAIRKAGLPEQFSGWGDGFINQDAWLAILYRDLDGP